jgi:hypothetical protein
MAGAEATPGFAVMALVSTQQCFDIDAARQARAEPS